MAHYDLTSSRCMFRSGMGNFKDGGCHNFSSGTKWAKRQSLMGGAWVMQVCLWVCEREPWPTAATAWVCYRTALLHMDSSHLTLIVFVKAKLTYLLTLAPNRLCSCTSFWGIICILEHPFYQTLPWLNCLCCLMRWDVCAGVRVLYDPP